MYPRPQNQQDDSTVDEYRDIPDRPTMQLRELEDTTEHQSTPLSTNDKHDTEDILLNSLEWTTSEASRESAPSAPDARTCSRRLKCGMMLLMELRPGLCVDDLLLADFATRHGVKRLALYGSALGERFNAASDVDILIEFHPGRTPGLIYLAQMELELEDALGRRVELRTYEDLSPHFRDSVATTARPLYAA